MIKKLELHDEARNCLEDCLAAVLSSYNIRFEIMFLYSWQFSYLDDLACSISEKMVLSDDSGKYDLLKKYCGVEMVSKEFNSYESHMAVLNEEVYKSNPVIASVDGYHAHWLTNDYHREHFLHTCVVRLPKGSNVYSCSDPFFGIDEIDVPLHMFKDSWEDMDKILHSREHNKLYYMTNKGEHSLSVDWRTILNEILERRSSESDTVSNYEKISVDFENSALVDNEKIANIFTSPIVIKIWRLAQQGRKMIRLLEYLESIQNEQRFDLIKTKFEDCANSWAVLRGIVIKYYLTANVLLLKRMRKLFRNIYTIENEIIRDLQCVLKNNSVVKSENDTFKTGDEAGVYKVNQIDLSGCFNNKGIGTLYGVKGNFDGANFYFLADGIPCSIETSYKADINVSYQIKIEEKFDNIACMEQSVVVNDNIRTIFILGASENGNYSSEVQIELKNKTVIKKRLEFSDWFHVPRFGEDLVWEGIAISSEGKKIPKVHLYSQKIELNESYDVSQIILPFCPTIHIFAVTLLSD